MVARGVFRAINWLAVSLISTLICRTILVTHNTRTVGYYANINWTIFSSLQTVTGDTLVASKASYNVAKKVFRQQWDHKEPRRRDSAEDTHNAPLLETIQIPEPVFFCTIEPPSQAYQAGTEKIQVSVLEAVCVFLCLFKVWIKHVHKIMLKIMWNAYLPTVPILIPPPPPPPPQRKKGGGETSDFTICPYSLQKPV